MTEIGYGSRAVLWDKAQNVGGAIHKIEAGKKTDMVFHTRLVKVLYLLGGDVIIRVIKDGQVKVLKFDPGTSLSIPPGFMYQLEANQESIVVEFTNDPSGAYSDDDEFKDVHVISKGTTPMLDVAKDTEPAIVMSEEDKEAAKKATKKKTTKKKSTSKKKTGKRAN